jgi:hypothetical protein
VIFYLYAISFFPAVKLNYMCLGIEPLFDLSIFTAVDKVKDVYCITRCENDQYIICTNNNMAASNRTVGEKATIS